MSLATSKPTPAIAAMLISLALFVVLLSMFHPIFNSKEDVYVLYLLTGAFGDEPGAFVHYNYGVHPFMGFPLMWLYKIIPVLPWYTLALLLPQFILNTLVIRFLLKSKDGWMGMLVYGLFFLLFGGQLLTFVNFTIASISCTASAAILMLRYAIGDADRSERGRQRSKRYLGISFSLLVLASCYRLHTMIPVLGLALPFILLNGSRKLRVKLVALMLIAGATIVVFHLAQELIYASHDPGWKTEEAYRQEVYQFYNRGNSLRLAAPGETWYAKQQLVSRGLLVDRNYISASTLDSMYVELKQPQLNTSIDHNWLKWFWINNRIFMISAGFLMLLFVYVRRTWLPLAISLLLLLILLTGLVLNAKMPGYMLYSGLMTISVMLITGGKIRPLNSWARSIAILMLVLLMAWSVYRLEEADKLNRELNRQCNEGQRFFASNPERIFIVLRGFPLQRFGCFQDPRHYQLPNYLDSEHFLLGIDTKALGRNGFSNFKSLALDPRAWFIGEPTDGLLQYVKDETGKNASWSAPQRAAGMDLRQLVVIKDSLP